MWVLIHFSSPGMSQAANNAIASLIVTTGVLFYRKER